MGFFRRNAGKFALVAIIAFFALPFIYGNEEENGFSPFAVRSGMSYQANPISRLADRIASFYGFPRQNNNDEGPALSVAERIKGKVATHNVFSKSEGGKDVSAKEPKPMNNFEKENTYSTGSASGGSTYTGSAFSGTNSNSPYKGTVRVNGKDYKVVEDIKGEKYVVTAKGHVPYRKILQSTVSEQEFLAAKKRMAGASDIEILQALNREKEQQFANGTSVNSGNYQNSYRTGTATSMGSGNVRPDNSLKTDKGFDDNFLSNAYDDLKNINIKVEQPESSGGGSSTTYYVSSGRGSKGGKEGKGEDMKASSGSSNGGNGGGFSAKDVYNDTLETVQNQRKENTGGEDQEGDAELLARKATLQIQNREIIAALTAGKVEPKTLDINTEEEQEPEGKKVVTEKLQKLKKSIRDEQRSIYVNPDIFDNQINKKIMQALFTKASNTPQYNTTDAESTIKINNDEDLKKYLMSKLEEIDEEEAELAATQDLAEAGTGENNETI